jgi:hypothetical protein
VHVNKECRKCWDPYLPHSRWTRMTQQTRWPW